jgi:phosphatidate phosphatase APP1
MSLLLSIAIVCQMASAESQIAADETVCFFPTYARQTDDGKAWQFRVHGWIFEREADSPKRRGLLAGLEKLLDLDDDPKTAEIFRARAAAFLVDNERNKAISIRIGERQFAAGISDENGHFESQVTLSGDELAALRSQNGTLVKNEKSGGERLKYQAVAANGDERAFRGEVLLISPTGISVISDIDDTIKITEVTDREKLIRNTLLKPFQPVPGMAELYRDWAERGAVFHYVTASPWQLFEPLCCLCEPKGFPHGTWHMKLFRWKDSTALDLFKSPEKYKPEIIERILADFPKRRFILVGDSGERDPEIYGAIARKHFAQIERILIREVNVVPQPARYDAAFADLPLDSWQVFKEPSEIRQPVIGN